MSVAHVLNHKIFPPLGSIILEQWLRIRESNLLRIWQFNTFLICRLVKLHFEHSGHKETKAVICECGKLYPCGTAGAYYFHRWLFIFYLWALGLCYNTMLSAKAFDFCILLLRTRDVNLGSWSRIENNQGWESRFATLSSISSFQINEIYILPNVRDSFNKVIFIVIFCHYSSRSVLVSPIINIIVCPIFGFISSSIPSFISYYL